MSKSMRIQIILLSMFYASLAGAYEVSDFLGKWQSNEKLTLDSMEAVPGIPDKARSFFREGFFGRLVVISRIDESAVYFIDEKPDEIEFHRHIIHKISDNQFRVEYPEEEDSSDSSGIMTLNGSCYSVEVSKWKFNEYFCRVE